MKSSLFQISPQLHGQSSIGVDSLVLVCSSRDYPGIVGVLL